MNCQVCGRHLNRMEIGKWQKDGHPLCSSCRKKELQEKVVKASPSQIKALKIREDDAPLIDEILKEHIVPEPIAQRRYTPAPKIEKCKAGEVYDAKLRKCVKLPERPPEGLLDSLNRRSLTKPQEQVHLPAPQVPAQPVVPVGPITIEQRLDAVEAAITELERKMANVLGLLGVHERRRR